MDEIEKYCMQLREHVAQTEKNSDNAKISIEAINSFRELKKSKVLSEDHLQKILGAAKSRFLGPYNIGTDLILDLITDFPELEIVLRELACSSSAHERWVAMTMVRSERIPAELAQELIQRAINDGSSKVRQFAIENVYLRCLNQLLPELIDRAEVEKNGRVMHYIEWVMTRMEYPEL